jgi:threonine/homoserine/homoserine lactone efflux protein
MIDITVLPLFMLSVLILMITPGPDMMFVTANAMAGGPKAGFASVLGVATGAYLHILGTAFGVTAIFIASEVAYNVVKIAGAAYICWIGIKIFTSKTGLGAIDPAKIKPLFTVYRQGVLTNLMNPKAALFTISFVPQFVSPAQGPIWSQILILGLIIVVVMIVVELPIVFAAGRFAEWLNKNERVSSVLSKMIGVTLIGLAAKIFVTRRPA